MIKKSIALLIGVLLFLTGCSSQPANHMQVVDEPSTQGITEPVVMTEVSEVQPIAQEVVKELSSDRYSGRLVGTPGNQLAAEYLANLFELSGFMPYEETSYLQPYMQMVANPEEQEPQVSIIMKDGVVLDLVLGTDYICSNVADDLDLDLPIVIDPEEDAELPGQCVLLFESGVKMRIPCAAMVVVDDEFNFAPSIHTRGNRNNQIMLRISTDVYAKMEEGEAERVMIKANAVYHQAEVSNVVGVIRGTSNPENRAVVLTAHFDHCGKQGESVYNGALDNAAGVAMMMDVARYVKETIGENGLDFDLVVAAVNSEELWINNIGNCAGSEWLASNLKDKYSQIYNINFDCVGGEKAGALALGNLEERSEPLVQALRNSLTEEGIDWNDEIYTQAADYGTFQRKGFAAVTVGQSNLSPSIHTPTDTYEKINYENIDKVARRVAHLIVEEGQLIFKKLVRNEDSMRGPDNIQWCEEAKEELIRRLDGRVLAFDEAYTFLYDDIRTTGTGYHPFKKLSEAQKYYPNFMIQEVINDFSVSKIDIDNSMQIGKVYWTIGQSLDRVPMEQISKIPIVEDDITDIKVEYYNSDRDEYLSFALYPNGMKGTLKIDPIEGMKDVFLLKSDWQETDEYEGFIYKNQGWTAEVKTYSKWYDESSDDYWPDWNTMQKPEAEFLDMIETIQIKKIADALIQNLTAQ